MNEKMNCIKNKQTSFTKTKKKKKNSIFPFCKAN